MPSTAAPFPAEEEVFHVTVASNFARAFDKYSRVYDKKYISQSTFNDQFFVLRRSELHFGIEKATKLLAKLGLAGDRLLVLEARVAPASLHANARTGIGRYLDGACLPVHQVHWLNAATVAGEHSLELTSVEEAYARSLACNEQQLRPFAALRPRSLSVLPIARACQAACKFCFSESSASLDQAARVVDLEKLAQWMKPAVAAGAERFVITGGGEPGLLKHASMLDLIALAASHFPKVVLITNGYHLAKREHAERLSMLEAYQETGLSVLAISRHHADARVNEAIMGLDTKTERLLASVQALRGSGRCLTLRLICVLQKGGVESSLDIARYLAWAAAQGADEVCFKELYVSTTLESAYHDKPENTWAHANQVPLSVLTGALPGLGFSQIGQLPWGAPFYAGRVEGHPLRVAAYTEPSLFWERANGLARSWNLMANGTCLVSLEDPTSHIALPGSTRHPVFPLKLL